MFFNVSKILGKNLALGGVVVIFTAFLAAGASEREVSFDSSLHHCVQTDTHAGPIYVKKGGMGPCHDFSDDDFGAIFKFKLLFHRNLSGSSFQGVEQKILKLKKKTLIGVNFSKTKIDLFLVPHSVLSFSNLSEAMLQTADFTDVTALFARFKGANLHGADLSRGNFSNAFFAEAVLTSATLQDIECRQCIFKDVKAQQIQAANGHFEEADFENAELKFGQFQNATFEGAILRGVNFSSANLDGVEFKGAELTGAVFHTASLKGADLSQVKGDEIKWRFATFDSNTKLPFSSHDAVEIFGMVFIP